MREFSTCTKNEEVIFNNLLRTARNQIESTFGRLKTRKINLKLKDVPPLIYSCFILHHFCEPKKVYLNEDEIDQQIERQREEETEQPNIPVPVYFPCNGEGEIVQNILTEYLIG